MKRTSGKTDGESGTEAQRADQVRARDAARAGHDAVRALRASEATLRGVMNAAPIGIGLVTDRVIGWTNRKMSGILGYEHGELEGMSARRLYESAEEYERVGRIKHDEVRRTGAGMIQTRMVRKDGIVIDVLLSSAAIDPADFHAGLVFTVMDITEMRRGEETRRRLAAAIEQAAEAIITFDRRARVEYVNPAFERITGFARDEVVGELPTFMESGAHSQSFYQRLWNTLLGGDPWHGRVVNRRKDGEHVEVECSIAPLKDDEETITGYIEVMRDITREVHLEKQLRQAQKMEAVGQLAGGVAHDFNNLLQVILGNADLALREIPPEQTAYSDIEQILRAGKRASTLVSHLLAFSRRQPIQPRVVAIDEQVAAIEPILRRMISESIELVFAAGAGGGAVYIDPGEIEQILINLAINARDAMPEGGRLDFRTSIVTIDEAFRDDHPWANEGDHVLIEVADTGLGMPPDVVERIFEPFFSTKGIDKGSGLGLSMVYGIVKRHGGIIEVESEPGEGTTFRLYLPTTDREFSPESAAEPAAANGEGSETILVAEDQEQVLNLAVKVLERAGYRVITARDGEEALARYDEHAGEIDLLLLDVMMPKRGGVSVFEQIRLQSDVPILFSSGYSFDPESDRRIPANAAIIQKPYTPGMLLESIRGILG